MKSEVIPFRVVDLAVGGELELPINYYDTLGDAPLVTFMCMLHFLDVFFL